MLNNQRKNRDEVKGLCCSSFDLQDNFASICPTDSQTNHIELNSEELDAKTKLSTLHVASFLFLPLSLELIAP